MFNKETEYALRALVYIQTENSSGRRAGIAQTAKAINAPPFFTAKILQRMVRQGFLSSMKGRGGGFFFEEGSTPLAIRDLIVAVEGGDILTGCAFGLKFCDESNPCPMHKKYAPIREAMNDLVSGETIQSLAMKSAGKGKK